MSKIRSVFISSILVSACFMFSFILMGGDPVRKYLAVVKYDLLNQEFVQKRQSRATLELKNEEPNNDKPILILVWRKIDSRFRKFNLAGCPFQNCKTTLDRSLANNSDAIVFPGRYRTAFPTHRPEGQIWIYENNESQLRSLTGKRLQHFNGKINYTFTTLRESDIIHNYGHFRKRDTIMTEDANEWTKRGNKTKLVAWIVSHCHTHSKRENYFKTLGKYIEADKFGRCAGGARKKCSRNCLESIAQEYKFYFAAENSICRDYITEKVFKNAYHLGMVPIVYGGANYSQYLPHKSYIDVKDFTSPKDLAEYLKKVASDDDLYNEYFAWKREYEVVAGWSDCNICVFMNQKNKVPKVYEDITTFWRTKDCVSGSWYLKSVSH